MPSLLHRSVTVSVGGIILSAVANGSGTKDFTILVAEDSETDTFFLRRAYREAALPHALLFVQDGQQLIDYLERKPPFSDTHEFPTPDLVLLDLKMPRMGGFDVLRWMRLVARDEPPILVLSGSNLDVDKSLALALGAREYHVKSADIHAVTKLLVDLSQRWLQAQS